MNAHNKSLKLFFIYLIVGFLVSSAKTDIQGKTPFEVLNALMTVFMFNFIVGIWSGLAALFGNDIYHIVKNIVKKNRKKNERIYMYNCQLFSCPFWD